MRFVTKVEKASLEVGEFERTRLDSRAMIAKTNVFIGGHGDAHLYLRNGTLHLSEIENNLIAIPTPNRLLN